MKKAFFSFLIVSLVSVIGLGQTQTKPKYAPGKSNHRNKTDELDRKQGLWKHYNLDGILTWELEYLDDRRHGISKRYYGNGRIMRETEYHYGIKDGVYKRYDFDRVITEGEYEMGKRSGHWTNYYNNGQVKSEGRYSNGHKNGEWTYYNKKGIKNNTIIFKDGVDVRVIASEEQKAAAKKKKAADAKIQDNKRIPKTIPVAR